MLMENDNSGQMGLVMDLMEEEKLIQMEKLVV